MSSATSSFMLYLSLFLGQDVCSIASRNATNAFLKHDDTHVDAHLTSDQLTRIQEFLEPIFGALPKNGHGAVRAPTARYALHRFFSHFYGIHIKGMLPAGGWWTKTTPTIMSDDVMPDRVRYILQGHQIVDGFQLQELVMLAAKLENAIHAENQERLSAVYRAYGWPWPLDDVLLMPEQVVKLLETYIAGYMLQTPISNMTATTAQWLSQEIVRKYPGWSRIQRLLRELQRNQVRDQQNVSFAAITRISDTLLMRLGQWHNEECHTLMKKLVELEDVQGQGRVQLTAQYGSSVHHESWQLHENEKHLAEVGAIDFSALGHKRVIIPNYVYGPMNWVASSSSHAIGCLNQCDHWIGHLERGLGAPKAKPTQLLNLMDNLPVGSPFKRSDLGLTLTTRLHEIAERHGGFIPIHGRLFAQWSHHAFPRECPYPHTSARSSVRLVHERDRKHGKEASVSEPHAWHGMIVPTPQERTICKGGNRMCGTSWSTHEELLDSVFFVLSHTKKLIHARSFILLLAFGSASVGLFRMCVQFLTDASVARKHEPRETYHV